MQTSHFLDDQLELLRRLAVGGMAEVWEAMLHGKAGFGKRLAVKRLLSHLEEREDLVHLFLNEGKLAAQLEHPNICQIFKLGDAAGSHYIAMEYVDGVNLGSILLQAARRGVLLPLGYCCSVVMDICAALEYAHALTDEQGHPLGIIHRDLSPSNIMVSWDGHVKVVDFGIARAVSHLEHTPANAIRGKFGYLSPEYVFDDPIDCRSDLFSIGIILWELLTGRRLFDAANDWAKMMKISNGNYPRPSQFRGDLPEALEQITMKALSLSPDERYPHCGLMLEALSECLDGQRPDTRKLGLYIQALMRDEALPEAEPRQLTKERPPMPFMTPLSLPLGEGGHEREFEGRHLLVIDDHRELLDALGMRLTQKGVHVALASTGAEALEHAQSRHFDACLLDLSLPDLDGREVLTRLKQLRPALPCIIHTANGSLSQAAELGRIGAFSYLHKPVSSKLLMKSLREAFEYLPQGQELEQMVAGHYPTPLAELRRVRRSSGGTQAMARHSSLAHQYAFLCRWTCAVALAAYARDASFDPRLNAKLCQHFSRPLAPHGYLLLCGQIGQAYRDARRPFFSEKLRDFMLADVWNDPLLHERTEALEQQLEPWLDEQPMRLGPTQLNPVPTTHKALCLLARYHRGAWRTARAKGALSPISDALDGVLSWAFAGLHFLAEQPLGRVDEVRTMQDGAHHNLTLFQGLSPQPRPLIAEQPLALGQLYLFAHPQAPLFTLFPFALAGPCPTCQREGFAFPVALAVEGELLYRGAACHHLQRLSRDVQDQARQALLHFFG